VLSSQQQQFFRTFGFLLLKNLYAIDEIALITERADEVLAFDRHGQTFLGEKRQAVVGFVAQDERLYRLLEDDRIYRTVEQLLGPGFVWIGSDGNLYVGDTGWHPDNNKWMNSLIIKIAFYLDPVSKGSGCLRVIPGSHLPGLGRRLRELWPTESVTGSPYGVDGIDVPCVALESEPGDVVIFDQRLFHASYGGRTGRRMFTINFMTEPREASDYEVLRLTYERTLQDAGELGSTSRTRAYTDAFLESPSPRIQGTIRTLKELGFE
jgi:Phytanoyl-CoA dioxygenase (PhyH)